MIEKIFQRFEKDKKIAYINGWIVITHFTKHQKFNPSTKTAAEEIILCIPIEVLQALDRLSSGCSYLNLNSNLTNTTYSKEKKLNKKKKVCPYCKILGKSPSCDYRGYHDT